MYSICDNCDDWAEIVLEKFGLKFCAACAALYYEDKEEEKINE